MQIDPMANAYANHTPYNYANNSPAVWNDPTGACQECMSNGISDVLEMRLSWLYSHGALPFEEYGPGSSGAQLLAYEDLMDRARAGDLDALQMYAQMNGGVTWYWNSRVEVTENTTEGEGPYTITLTGEWKDEQTQGGILQASFGFGEGLGSLELALAGLKPTFDGAAYMARLQGGAGEVPLFLKKNLFASHLARGNNALYIGRVSSSTAIGTASTLSKLAPALTGLGVLTNGYDIIKDGRLTSGDGFQAVNTGLMIAFPVYGVIYGVVDLGFGVFTDQSLTDRIKSGIDSNVSGSISLKY